jgi:Fanconi-associated nuclease 1
VRRINSLDHAECLSAPAVFHEALRRRITRLESALDLKAKQRHNFTAVGLRKATKRVLEGEKLSDGATGRKSSWRASDGAEVSVEAFSLEFYERYQGWRGFHSENGILTSIVRSSGSPLVLT